MSLLNTDFRTYVVCPGVLCNVVFRVSFPIFFKLCHRVDSYMNHLFVLLIRSCPIKETLKVLNTSCCSALLYCTKCNNCTLFARSKGFQKFGKVILHWKKSPRMHHVLYLFHHHSVYHIRLLMIPYTYRFSSVPRIWVNFVLYSPEQYSVKTMTRGLISARGIFHPIHTESFLTIQNVRP